MTVSQEIADMIVSPMAHAERDALDAAFAQLRKEAPLTKIQPKGYHPFWAVTKFNDILEIERNNEVFHNGGDFSAVILDIETVNNIKALTGGRSTPVHHMTEMDGKEHIDHRFLTQKYLMPVSLKKLEERISEMAADAIENMASLGGECNFTKDVAFLYPLRVIMELLGVPPEDEPMMLKLTQEFLGSTDPDMNGGIQDIPPEQQVEIFKEVMVSMKAYFQKITDDRRVNPREDIASVIANGVINGEPIGYDEAMSYYILVATAGHDTTSNSLASSMWQLAENPDQFKLLKENPSLIPSFIEESLRWETPVRSFMRNAVEDCVVSGQQIKKGDLLMLCFPSANRDEDIYDEPFKFNIQRPKTKHLAFGHGVHLCLGQHLGRLEMRVFWEQLLPRLESVEISGDTSRVIANFVSGPKSLPIRYKMT